MPEKSASSSALYRAADRSTRRYGLRAVLFLVVALVAALGSAVLLTGYVDKRTNAARVPTESVLVAAEDLAVGTELHAQQLRAVAWPANSIPEGAFSDPKELEGKLVATRVYKGEPILPPLLAGSEAGKGLSALLPPGMRAAAVRVDDIVGVAGFIHPGDSVDVIATMRLEGSSSNVTASRVILQAIRVLAVGKDIDAQSKGLDKVVPATVATLLVTAEQSERLALGASQGKLLLTLRGQADVELVETKGVDPNKLLVSAQHVPPLPPPPPAAPKPEPRPRISKVVVPAPAPAPETAKPVAAPPPERGEVVEILRGDLFERRDFKKESKQ